MTDFEYKQIIILRDDIKMGCGKKCVQVAHASIGSYKMSDKKMRKKWFKEGQKKVVLKVGDEDILDEISKKLEECGIGYAKIVDFGLTEIEPNTFTAIGVEILREDDEDLNKATANLKLL